MRNLITDVPGVLVGNAHDARAATGVTVAVFEQSVVASVATLGGAPGDRARHAARARDDARHDRRHRPLGRLALRSRCRGRRHGRAVPPGQGRTVRRPHVAGRGAGHPVRPDERRNEGLADRARGQAAALLGSRSRRHARGRTGFRAGHGGRGLWRHHGHRQGRARLGKRTHATGLHRRCTGGGERGRLGADRRWAAFLGRRPTSRAPSSAAWAGRRRSRPRRSPCASRASRRRRPPPPSPWSRPTPRSPRPSASGSPSWPTTACRRRCGPCTRPTTATRCSRPPPAGPGRVAIRRC